MKRTRSYSERSLDKSFETLMSLKLTNDYSLSPIEAQTLTADIRYEIENNQKDLIKEGQVLFTAVTKDEPAGKPLIKCKTKRIKLDVYPTELIELSFTNHKAYNKLMVQRLCWEALAQGCNLTQEDLARLLHCSVSTIRRIISQYRKENVFVPTRGNYNDIGPGLSHKYEAVKRYLKGYTVTEISKAMSHHPRSIERYIDDFTMVYTAFVNEKYTPLRISRMLRISERIVKEYLTLFVELKDNADCQHQLEQIKLRAGALFQNAKKKKEQAQ